MEGAAGTSAKWTTGPGEAFWVTKGPANLNTEPGKPQASLKLKDGLELGGKVWTAELKGLGTYVGPIVSHTATLDSLPFVTDPQQWLVKCLSQLAQELGGD
jgi:hypothetical protein